MASDSVGDTRSISVATSHCCFVVVVVVCDIVGLSDGVLQEGQDSG